MNGKDIKFAKEFSFTLKLEELPEGFKVNQELRYRVLGDSIILELEKTAVPAEIVEPVKDVQNNLAVYSGRSILRLDLINKEKRTLVVTLLCFYQQIDFENFVIVVDQAIHSELRKRKIEVDGAVSWIKKQIIFADHYVFALGENKKKSELLLLGKDIEILVAETPQGYLHIVEIRNNRGNFNEGIISLITGNISIEDRITEKAAITAEFKDRYNKLIRDNAELINLWRIYDSLEMEAIKQDALSMGYAKYRSYKRNGDQLCFSLDGCYVEPDFLRSDMYYVAIPVAEFNQEAPLDYDPRKAAITGTEYDPTCIHTAEFRILEDARDDFRKIPAQGYLLPSISGSVIQSKRRKIALENILSGKNQLSGLNVLLQSGEVVGVVESHRSAITGSLERYIFEGKKGRHFLDRQKKAIDVAINTPDIALIQGPPGTGKTLVIRSIVQRINELENGQAKILVTSTQHDAVDNAIKNMTYGGVPVNRAISKLRNKSGNLPIYQWIDGMIESCDSWLTAHAEKDTDPFSQLNQILDSMHLLGISFDRESVVSFKDGCIQVNAFGMDNTCYYRIQSEWNAYKELELDVAVEEKLEVAFELPNCSTADFSWENVADFMRVDGNNAIFCRKPSPIERNNIYTLCQKPQAIVRQMSADRRTSYKNTLRIWREWVDFVLSSTCLRNPGQKSLAIKPYFIASEADKKRILELSDMLFEEADENNRTAFLLPTEWINYREVDDSRVLRRLLNFGDSFDEVDEDDLKNYRLSVLPVTQTDVGSIQRLMKLISLQRSVLMMEWQSEQQTKCPICQEDNIHRTAQNSWKCDNLSCGVEWGKTRCTTKCKEWFYWIQPGSDMVKKLRFQDVQCDTPCEAIQMHENIFDRYVITDFEIEPDEGSGNVKIYPICPICGGRRKR